MDEFKDTNKRLDKVKITSNEVVSEYDEKTYTEFEFEITELYGYGAVFFKPALVVRGSIEKGSDIARFYYDFGMSDEVYVNKENNWLYNYAGKNNECDSVKTVFASVKYDLQHAFNHIDIDPNFGHRHWALRECLRSRVKSFDWYEKLS